MAIKFKGEVPFTDSNGTEYVLRLGQFQIVSNQKALSLLSGQEHQAQVFLIALRAGKESQEKFTLEDASELIDDIGFTKLDTLLKQTKFYSNVNEAADAKKAELRATTARAAALLMVELEALRDGDSATSLVIDALEKKVAALQPAEGSANPPETTITSN